VPAVIEITTIKTVSSLEHNFRLRFVGTKLLQNHPVYNTRSYNFRRLGPKVLSAEPKIRRHTHFNFMLAIMTSTPYMRKHVSAIHKAQKQGRLHRRVLPAGTTSVIPKPENPSPKSFTTSAGLTSSTVKSWYGCAIRSRASAD
jgi:hypothetical protein